MFDLKVSNLSTWLSKWETVCEPTPPRRSSKLKQTYQMFAYYLIFIPVTLSCRYPAAHDARTNASFERKQRVLSAGELVCVFVHKRVLQTKNCSKTPHINSSVCNVKCYEHMDPWKHP